MSFGMIARIHGDQDVQNCIQSVQSQVEAIQLKIDAKRAEIEELKQTPA